MAEFEDYERICKLIRRENKLILDAFEKWLSDKGLSEKTVYNHRSNIDFYINEFLLRESPKEAAEGVDEVGAFLGFWFISKAMWASESSIRSNAASLKKFYEFMLERGVVTAGAEEAMRDSIKEGLPEWIAAIKRYDDPAIDIEDVWDW